MVDSAYSGASTGRCRTARRGTVRSKSTVGVDRPCGGGFDDRIGQTPPAWIGVQSLPVVQSNVLESYKTVFKKDPPPQLADACKKAAPACG